ncbi:hypothetical protein EDB84DRAFT_1562507 [Lactarius hengduanensis]|nr:hypothetical protein EDB84DRAFT_1562507 [Lactarius hengduanensis]
MSGPVNSVDRLATQLYASPRRPRPPTVYFTRLTLSGDPRYSMVTHILSFVPYSAIVYSDYFLTLSDEG